MIHDDLAAHLGFVPEQPIDATRAMPAVRPAPAPAVSEPDEVLRRLAAIEAKLDLLLATPRSAP